MIDEFLSYRVINHQMRRVCVAPGRLLHGDQGAGPVDQAGAGGGAGQGGGGGAPGLTPAHPAPGARHPALRFANVRVTKYFQIDILSPLGRHSQ